MNLHTDGLIQQMRERLDRYLTDAGSAVIPEPAEGMAVESGIRSHQVIADPIQEWVMVQATVWVKSFRRKVEPRCPGDRSSDSLIEYVR